MPLVLRTDKGSPLTIAEGDGNLTYLDDRIDTVSALVGKSIDSITYSASAITFNLSDSSTVVVPLPALQLNPRGEWMPSTAYSYGDLVHVVGSGLYLVLVDHTSATSFDPDATDGTTANNSLYDLFGPTPARDLPIAGSVGQVVRKASTDDYDVEWHSQALADLADIAFPTSGPASGDILQFDGSDWASAAPAGIGLSVADLADVVEPTSGASVGDLLQFDGTDWASTALADLGIDFTDLTGIATPSQVRQATVTTLGTSGTISLDPTLGDVFKLTPTGDVTLNAASAPAGARITLIVITSGTTSRNITPSTNFKSTGVLVTGTVTAKYFTVSFVGDGTNLIETSRTVAM